MTDWIRMVAIAVAVLLGAVACVDENGDVLQPAADPDPTATAESTAENGASSNSVGLEIFEGPGGSVIVFVPVYIQGEGPFDFVLDTGASRSVIDQALADQFDFPESENVGDVTGISGPSEVNLIKVENWNLGETIELPTSQVTAFSVIGNQEGADVEGQIGRDIQGLLGSDLLSQFGAIRIDYDAQRLTVAVGD